MLITYLQLVIILIRFHEESALDVEEHGQVFVELDLIFSHFYMCQCPRCRSKLILEVEKTIHVRSSTKKSPISAVLFTVSRPHPLDIGILVDQRNYSSLSLPGDEIDAEPSRFAGGTLHALPSMHPASPFRLVKAFPVGKLSSENAAWHCRLESLFPTRGL